MIEAPTTETVSTLSFAEGQFYRRGKQHRILAGSLHYFRVHPELWRDRLERIAALGVNTVDTYVAWNFHERRQGEVRWDGWRDLERFLTIASEIGLDAIVRPGPYICAEWDNGALPSWVTRTPGLIPRSSNAAYLDAVAGWFDQLLPRLAPLQASSGGPIIAVQLENEFGSYGDDSGYLRALLTMLRAGGINELIYTADGPTELMLDGGTVPGVMATATFGSRAREASRLLRSRRPAEPFMCAEMWNGWFDHWGEAHHVRSAVSAAATVEEIVREGGSVSLYMAHGGTNFGLWAGANHDEVYQPTQTSYDSDAPIAEDGSATRKFLAIRDVMSAARGIVPPALPPLLPRLTPRTLPIRRGAGLLAVVRAQGEARRSPSPLTFDQLGIDAGLVLYTAEPVLPSEDVLLTIDGLRDRAIIFVDGERAAVVDASAAVAGVLIVGEGRQVTLEILVENQGRINYGHLLGEDKGILGGVRLDRRLVQRWESRPVPLEEWDEAAAPDAPFSDDGGEGGFATATVQLDSTGDTFLAFPGFCKGFVWVNGFLLGRYWEIGPQRTYYVPAPLLRVGDNVIRVLELERFGDAIEMRDSADLGPEEAHDESFI